MKPLSQLNRDTVRQLLEDFDLRTLFIEELGWDHGGADITVALADKTYLLQPIAQKRGFVAYQCVVPGRTVPDRATRQKIERQVAKVAHEHLVVYATKDHGTLCWQWVKRELNRPPRYRQYIYSRGQRAEALAQRLEHLRFTLDEEARLTIADPASAVAKAFDVEKVTKRFYERFREEHKAFLGFIKGIRDVANREWYASLMLNRMMFIYFIQKRGFLDGDRDYLRNRLATVAKTKGNGKFHGFYRLFLRRLFHEGLGQPEAERDADLTALLGRVPYLNGGLFDVHELERDHTDIDIPDKAFKRIFDFFDAYQWHLDDRPLRDDNEINPDVLGYIFEKYVNQKQMGAYYTKEDITGYISRNTVVPRLFDQARRDCAIAFKPGGGVWRLLAEDPDRYFYPSVRHGITFDMSTASDLDAPRTLPKEIAAGLENVAKRDKWNNAATPEYGLPTETWREHVARRQRYEEVRAKLAAGEVSSINDLVTYNLDIERFAQDAISTSEGPELVRAFWKAIGNVTILDPTVGSGAFLFAALNILEPLYNACLDAMRSMVEDLQHSRRRHRPERLSDFRKVIAQVEEHPSERYFVLKSIVIDNLYGVDIMEEAVEICKLRLFLKLVAQLERYDQIEPLPDVDFNVRPGNTLVGFTSMAEIEKRLGGDCIARGSLPDIQERAEVADRAFRQFRSMQTERHLDAAAFSDAKATLRHRLDALRERLDAYLADDYGVPVRRKGEYGKWQRSHQPFHWLVEFYGIIERGGFDVVIGNPPYLEAREVPYRASFETATATVHSMCVERSLQLGNTANMSMIVPLSLVSTQRMAPLQQVLEDGRNCWYSNFAWRPGKLFDTVNRALSIFVTTGAPGLGKTFSTAYLKWNSASRKHLMPTVTYAETPRDRTSFWVPKFGGNLEASILAKIQAIEHTARDLLFVRMRGKDKLKHNTIYYRTTGGLYWKVFTDFAPMFSVGGILGTSTRETTFLLSKRKHVRPVIATLSSSLFWWWYTVASNLRDLNPADWQQFPMPQRAVDDRRIALLGSKYVRDLKRHSEMLVREQKTTGRTETQSFKVSKSKHIIDEIDAALAPHYGFTAEELDFIINYDIKYRLS